jgi:hypothetical protein
MSFNWPEAETPRPPRRPSSDDDWIGPRVGGDGHVDLFANPTGRRRRVQDFVPTLLFILVLLVLGLILAWSGPLPTIFPTFD